MNRLLKPAIVMTALALVCLSAAGRHAAAQNEQPPSDQQQQPSEQPPAAVAPSVTIDFIDKGEGEPYTAGEAMNVLVSISPTAGMDVFTWCVIVGFVVQEVSQSEPSSSQPPGEEPPVFLVTAGGLIPLEQAISTVEGSGNVCDIAAFQWNGQASETQFGSFTAPPGGGSVSSQTSVVGVAFAITPPDSNKLGASEAAIDVATVCPEGGC